ncbi:MAG: sugar ABC transporter ATP-binding protein [Actinomycetota bacterium]|jgi:ribose transport system ATP-binding protein|nr:sugar ABC transporter ATP-binding protein [Actinomycetota bacterium]MDA8279355.1 sugar ABC transporter ATP-binding protein [Actinomycetota bacterium]
MDESTRAGGEVLIGAESLVKSFGGVRALDRVSVDICLGEVRGLVGENGSGKSTFIKVLAGYHRPDSGSVRVGGELVPLPIRLESLPSTYIGFVHQDLGMAGDLSVIENFFVRDIAMSRHRALRGKFVPRKAYRQRLRACLDRYRIPVRDLNQAVGELSPLHKAMIAIVRAVDEIERSGAVKSLLVLDEPTVYLPVDQREVLYGLIRDVVADNNSVLLVSHDIDEVLQVADTITIFRDGKVIDTVKSSDRSRRDVVEMMVGLAPGRIETMAAEAKSSRAAAAAGDCVVEMTNVRSGAITDATLRVHAGEIVGLAGLAGSGYELVPRIVYGLMPVMAGSMEICRQSVPRRYSPASAIDRGVVLVPRDRIREGGVGTLTVNENVFFPIRSKFTNHGLVQWKDAWSWVHDQLVKFDVRPPDGTRELSTLSGGNQQKAIFSKWSQMQPKLMLLEEPTQGVDVGARLGIWGFIREAAAGGAGILVASSDYEELVELCDRVVIVASGAVVSELDRDELSKQNILNACYARANAERTGL